MGIIKRQGIKSTIVNYAGALIGAFAVLFIYPLDDEIYGYAQWLYNTAYLLIPIASLGIGSTVVKFFPAFREKSGKGYNGFLTLVFLSVVIVFFIFLLSWSYIKVYFLQFLEYLKMDSGILEDNQVYVIILTGLLILIFILVSQCSNLLRIVIPNIINQFAYKAFLPILILVYVYYEISRETFAKSILIFFATVTLLLIIYLWKLGGLKFGGIRKPKSGFRFKDMLSYSLFGSLNQLSSGIAVRLDSIMIPFFLGMTKNGFYGKALFITNVIEIPTRSLVQIAGPIISKAWEENDYEELNKVYKKASANLFLVGVFVFLSLWLVLDDLINISSNPDTFPYARGILLLVGSAKLFDMITSVNTQLIIYSKKYRYNLIFLGILAVSNLYLNYKLIPEYDILGAAIATSISLAVYNIIKLVFLYVSYGLHPFTVSNLKALLLLLVGVGCYYLFPVEFHPIINGIIKMTVLCIIFLPIAYFWNISEDVNQMVIDFIKKFKS